jgi:hypothetical protein
MVSFHVQAHGEQLAEHLFPMRGRPLLQLRRFHDHASHGLHAIAGDWPDALDDVVENRGMRGLQRVDGLNLGVDIGQSNRDRGASSETPAATAMSARVVFS